MDSFVLENLCGERGIRTPETLLEFTRFPGVPLQPLEHLSFVATGLQEETRMRVWLAAVAPLNSGSRSPRYYLYPRAHEALGWFSRLSLCACRMNDAFQRPWGDRDSSSYIELTKFDVGCDIRRYGLALRPSKISVRSMRSICRYKVT